MKSASRFLALVIPWLAIVPASHAVEAVRGETFIGRLRSAPFPYEGLDPATGRPFFDILNAAEGRRYHTTFLGTRYREREHYRDDRVLFHLPPGFDKERGFFCLVYFHGQNTEIESAAREGDVVEQVDASGANVVLVMPQLARYAWDSSPGKFWREGAFRDFLDEAGRVLGLRLGGAFSKRFASAPLVLAAHSGGGKALAWVLEKGGVDGRIRSVVLFDALYDEVDKYGKWLRERGSGALLLSFFTMSTVGGNKELMNLLGTSGIVFQKGWCDSSAPADRCFVGVESDHDSLPRAGPPAHPLAPILRRVAGG